MLSTPPATNASPSPALIACAALATACRPEPHRPIDGLPGNVDRKSGQQRCHARDVAVVFARLVRAAEDHIVERGRIESGALDRGPHGDGGEVVGPEVASAPPARPTGVRTAETMSASLMRSP